MMPLVIVSSRITYVWYLLIALTFVLGGALMVREHGHDAWVGWMCMAFFGMCAVIFIRQIIDTRPRLVIDDKGVMDRTLGLGVIPWSEMKGARLKSIHGQDFVCLELRNMDRWLDRLPPLKRRLASTNVVVGFAPINLNLSGVNADAGRILQIILKMIDDAQGEKEVR